MLIRAFTILSLTFLAIGFMGACYSGVEQPGGPAVSLPAIYAASSDIG